ncbi:MAG: penicillin-binding transpeptidase domain-containing protein [Defluviitaleaceae bacterium]|nr:penicillin-binding transpeptidase domain-containing protein [Defluviitaleaceae bacterium]
MNEYKEKIIDTLKFFTNRMFVLAAICIVGFGALVVILFQRQIVEGTYHVPTVSTFARTISANAPRGQIFDVNGRPLAVSIPVFTVMLDPSVVFSEIWGQDFDLNEAFLLFMQIMQRGGEEIRVDAEFIISQTTPRIFTVSSEATIRRWLNDFHLDGDLTATQAYTALLAYFNIPQTLNRDDQHTLLLLRSALYLQRFNVAQIGLAIDIDRRTVAALEEFSHAMPGVYVASDYMRYYPMGKYLTNIIGYLTRISAGDLEANQHLGYTANDLFGAAGIERTMEHYLRGTRGITTIEVDNNRRRVGVLDNQNPQSGHDIFLTIDATLQRNLYYILEDYLSEILVRRLRSLGAPFARDVLISTLESNNINSLLIMDADDAEVFPASYTVRAFVLNNGDIDHDGDHFRRNLNEFIGENIGNGRITLVTMLEVMEEQGVIRFATYDRARLRAGQITPANFIIHLVETRQLTPQMVNIDPATGSIVISCVETGGIIAAVNYPTFDGNNFLPHSRDNAYITNLMIDPTRPQLARTFTEAIAPGSTFKMITGLAGVSQGVITPETRFFCSGVFREAGRPYLRCHSHHGSLNLTQAIAASCNYFFNRVAWQLGNPRDGRTVEGITTLNYYMQALGLGAPTGIEVEENRMFWGLNNDIPALASPALRMAQGNPGSWTAGMTSHVSIGQGYNAYSPTSMAKVMATLATQGTRMEMTLINRIQAADGTVTLIQPVVEYQMNISDTHWNAIHEGMRMVTRSNIGTGRGIFAGFPMDVGIKSGTAEISGRASHSSYGGFAPLDNPQIAAYVMIPHGDQRLMSAISGHILRATLEEYFGINNTTTQTNNGIR